VKNNFVLTDDLRKLEINVLQEVDA
jgi:hypothetical protein